MAPAAVGITAGPAAIPHIGAVPAVEAHPTIAQRLGSGNPSGALISIAATPNAAAVGDFVIVQFCWATGGTALSTVTDTSGNTWTVVSTPATNEAGGYGYTVVTTGWASGANTVTGTLASGAPGGRCWTAASIPAAYTPTFDQQATTAPTTDRVSVSIGALAQATEVVFIIDVVRGLSGAIPTWNWNAPFTGLTSVTGVPGGTTSSGCAIGVYDNLGGTNAVTGGFNDVTSSTGHGVSIMAVKVTTTATNQTVLPPAATATASSPVPGVDLGILVPVATASASSPIPTVGANSQVSPPAATATASFPIPGIDVGIVPPVATATASFPTPAVAVTQLVAPPAATANASSPVPGIALNIPIPAATASASAKLPGVGVAVPAPVATAAASAKLPGLGVAVPIPVATAAASAPAPSVTAGAANQNVAPPVATASASSPIPTVVSSNSGPIIITSLNDGDLDFHFVPRFY